MGSADSFLFLWLNLTRTNSSRTRSSFKPAWKWSMKYWRKCRKEQISKFGLLCPPCHNSLERSWSCILPSLWPTYHCLPFDAFPAKSQPDVWQFLKPWHIHISSRHLVISNCHLKGFPSFIRSWHPLFHKGQSPEILNIHILNDVMNWWLVPV